LTPMQNDLVFPPNLRPKARCTLCAGKQPGLGSNYYRKLNRFSTSLPSVKTTTHGTESAQGMGLGEYDIDLATLLKRSGRRALEREVGRN